jgi:riboflavin kinase/FMN adenylyltransferase
LRDKLEALRTNGVDRVVVEHFNHTFASQSPDTFVENVIVNGLHARWVMIGDDFRYGAKRAGDFGSLVAAGGKYGFEIEQMATVADTSGARISSSGVRASLVAGNLDAARLGVASLGLRPTVDDSGRVLLETFVLDWHGDAYGKLVRIEFLKKLRNEEKYIDLETLTAAIARDVANAREYFAAGDLPGTGDTGFATSATDRIR